jgi:periplasmic protein TonB
MAIALHNLPRKEEGDMFDTVTGRAQHLPSHATVPILVSTTAQAIALTTVLMLPALFVADAIPEIPTMMAFVAPPPAPPAPPPPPAPRPAVAKPTPQAQPIPSTSELVAPVEVPREIAAEPKGDVFDEGVPGGVEGGVPGGVVGGVVGGLPEPVPPPPPPAPRGPVRVGGQIQVPALLHRVEPNYPPLAVAAHLQGVVILEAIVDRDGKVAEVKVLRSAGALLDREALLAVRQWRYSPLVLNGHPERFVLTVTLSFHLEISS